MLPIKIPETEYFDEEKNEFVTVKEQELHLEHSLLSISKWEAHYCRPFISDQKMTAEETLFYIRCMTINRNIDPAVYYCLTNEHIEKIIEYIEAPMTATTITDNTPGVKRNKEQLTSELIYYYMVEAGVPESFEKWHLNRLIMLLRIIGIKRDPHAKKMSKSAIMKQNKSLNAARRKARHSRG